MKLIKKLLMLILIIIIIVGGICYINGKKLYDEVLSEEPLSIKVQNIRDDENFVCISELPDYYTDAVISVEDHRFESHGVVDFIALCRAFVSNIKQGEFREGGSTITQQTAKNLYFITEDDVVSRKVAEILVGIDLEKNYSKDEILELYVNTIYFGDGYYGIKEACEGYLNKEPKDMTLYDATMLAGIPNAPSVYAPTANFDLTQSRQKKVVSSMLGNGYLGQAQAEALYSEIDSATFNNSNEP
ncbi:MAG: transglycosylase domain-containing protein [Clostridia bacterium]